jgi:biopolymer transport protein ExbD
MAEINVTPLVDVMLVLLVVFIITAPLLMQAVPVALPETAAVEMPEMPHHVPLTINAQGVVYMDRQAVPVENLEAALRNLRTSHADISVQLYADENVKYGIVAEVMAAVSRAGITRLGFITRPE